MLACVTKKGVNEVEHLRREGYIGQSVIVPVASLGASVGAFVCRVVVVEEVRVGLSTEVTHKQGLQRLQGFKFSDICVRQKTGTAGVMS